MGHATYRLHWQREESHLRGHQCSSNHLPPVLGPVFKTELSYGAESYRGKQCDSVAVNAGNEITETWAQSTLLTWQL